MPARTSILALAALISATALAQAPAQPDWPRLEAETMQHFQALLRLDTSNPPGHEKLAGLDLGHVASGRRASYCV